MDGSVIEAFARIAGIDGSFRISGEGFGMSSKLLAASRSEHLPAPCASGVISMLTSLLLIGVAGVASSGLAVVLRHFFSSVVLSHPARGISGTLGGVVGARRKRRGLSVNNKKHHYLHRS